MQQFKNELMDVLFHFHKLKLSSIMPISQSDCHILSVTEKLNEEVGEGSGAKVSEVARRIKLSVPSISRTLNHLEKKGYVKRYQDVRDRRNTYVSVTDAGRDILREVDQIMVDYLDAIFVQVDEQRMRDLIDFLKEIYQVAEEEIEKRKYNDRKDERHDTNI